MAIPSPGFFHDLDALYNWGIGPWGSLQGKHACFALELSDSAVECDDCFLVKAWVQQQVQLELASNTNTFDPQFDSGSHKILLRATKQDYVTVLRHSKYVRLIQAFVHYQDEMVILDATSAPSFFAGQVEIRKEECLQIAELFCGGFGGWSRAASLLRHAGVKIHSSWVLERDSECVPVLAATDPDLVCAETIEDIPCATQPSNTVLIHEDFNTLWWRPVVSKRPVQVMCASPPCQPWSSAGQEAGFSTQDGQLLLQMADFAKATLIPIWVVEEVANFPKHEHFPVFVRAMEHAGYKCAWQGLFQLSEVSSTFRLRFFMIWVLRSHEVAQAPFTAQVWRSLRSPSLARMDTVFSYLPRPLLDPCLLTAEVEAMYMDPQFMPPGRTGPRTPEAIERARVVKENQQANCFMAQYHYQHLLPPSLLLRKGLMGCILQTSQGKRFAAAPEVASAHGACFAFLVPTSDRTAMRILGNALAVQHACVVLGLALQLLPGAFPAPAACVELCLSHQLTASTTLLLEVEAGWLMCHPQHAGVLQARMSLRSQIQAGLCRAEPPFRPAIISAGCAQANRSLECHVSTQLKLADLLHYLHFSSDDVSVDDCNGVLRVTALRPLVIPLVQSVVCPAHQTPCLHVVVQGKHYFLHRSSPDLFAQMFWVFQGVPGRERRNPACYDVAGNRHRDISRMPALLLVTPDMSEVMQEVPQGPGTMLRNCRALAPSPTPTTRVPYEVAVDWWLMYPTHLAAALGFTVEHSCFPPPEGTDMLFGIKADPAGIFSVHNMTGWLRVLLVLAPVRHSAELARRCTGVPCLLVEVQLVAKSLWIGQLPASFRPEQLLDWWSLASEAVGLNPSARVFSGPHPLDPAVPLSKIGHVAAPAPFMRKRTGALLLTLMPIIVGGGAKDEKLQNAQAQVAQLCLAKGLTLAEANTVTTQLVQHAGQVKMQQALNADDEPKQWEQLQALLSSAGLNIPASSKDIAARVARKVHQQARKKNLFAAPLKADTFALAGDFFLNEDGSPCTLLHSLLPRASGVILLDPEIASGAIPDLMPCGPDEFAVVCMRHRCPHPQTCQQRLHVPVHAKVTTVISW